MKNLTLDFSTTEEIEDDTDKNTALIDDIVTVYCSYDNPDEVNPPPSMKILMKNDNDLSTEKNNEMLLAKGGIDDNNSTSNKYIGFNELRATKKISRGDADKIFVCECVQLFEDQIIFFNSISSEPIKVFQKPTLEENYLLPDYYLVNETNSSDIINIPVKFSSIPQPENKHIIWTIEEFNVSEGNKSANVHELGENETFIIHPGTLISRYSTHPLRHFKDNLYDLQLCIKIGVIISRENSKRHTSKIVKP